MSTDIRLRVVPISLREAGEFISVFHRHHRPKKIHKFSVGVARETDGLLVGVAVVSIPAARALADGHTLEVARTCTDGTPNANSALYGAAWRTAKGMGYARLVTYTQEGESGASLRGAGWRVLAHRKPRGASGGWNMPNRARVDHHDVDVPRTLWGIGTFGNETPPQTVVIGNESRCAVYGCGAVIERAETGRPRMYCSSRCRVRAHRARTAPA